MLFQKIGGRFFIRGSTRSQSVRKSSSRTKASETQQDAESSSVKSLNKTLLTPGTKMPLKMNNKVVEIKNLNSVTKEACLHQKSLAKKGEPFIFHEYPYYTNGRPQIGHFYNKTIKDIISRFAAVRGKSFELQPGWNLNGMVVEMKAFQKCNYSMYQRTSIVHRRKASQAFAEQSIQNQTDAFLRWGVSSDLASAYQTTSFDYISRQYNVFLQMYQKGLIFKDVQPVSWSPQSITPLDQHDLDYSDYTKTHQVYVSSKVLKIPARLASLIQGSSDFEILSWSPNTTLMPSIQAMTVWRDTIYVIARDRQRDKNFLIAKEKIVPLQRAMSTNYSILKELAGSDFEGLVCDHPVTGKPIPMIVGSQHPHDDGTGVRQSVPSQDYDDFLVAKNYKIEPLSIIDETGCYTSESNIKSLVGVDAVYYGTNEVLKILTSRGCLLKAEKKESKQVVDWRVRKGVLTRLSHQWFVRLDKIIPEALEKLQQVQISPSGARTEIENYLRDKKQWCISRQRVWGTPIPVLYREDTGEPLVNSEIMTQIKKLFQEHGSDCWWSLEAEKFLPNSQKYRKMKVYKEVATFDAYFDSSVSWMMHSKSMKDMTPADLCVENNDQTQAWFPLSMITAVATTGKAPYKKLIAHATIMDQQGRKMAPMIGNIVDHDPWIDGENGNGADVLRTWVALSNQNANLSLTEASYDNAFKIYAKTRGICRGILATLKDYTPTIIDKKNMRSIDLYMLHLLAEFENGVVKEYENHSINQASMKIFNFLRDDIDNFYLESTRERLVANAPSNPDRLSIQFVNHMVYKVMMAAAYPLIPFTAQDIHKYNPISLHPNIFEESWPEGVQSWYDPELGKRWGLVRLLREQIIELAVRARQQKYFSTIDEAKVHLCVEENSPLAKAFSVECMQSLKEAFRIAELSVSVGNPYTSKCPWEDARSGLFSILGPDGITSNLHISITRKDGTKCARCGVISEPQTIIAVTPDESVCRRCDAVLKEITKKKK